MENDLETEKIQKKLDRLRRENAAFLAQTLLLDSFVAMARSPFEGEMLKNCLQQTLELATELTGAEKGSIFLLDEKGRVTDSILTRKAPAKEKSKLIGNIMDKGLAGWVCRHRICGVVHDTDTDERWLPLAGQPYTVGSALAMPIIRGEALFGILTLLHSQKAHFSETLIEAMQGTADQIALVLDNVKLYVELAKAKEAVDTYSKALNLELEKGRKIQRDFLPTHLPRLPNLEIAAEFTPALQVSGDFYDAFALPGNNVGLVVGDVSDKGVGAALYMALIRSFIRMFAGRCCEEALNRSVPDALHPEALKDLQRSALSALDITNDYLAREHDAEGMFATVFFGVINSEDGWLQYINAGHPPVYIIVPNGPFQRLTATGPAVGLQGGVEYASQTVRLKPGSILFGYTDGVTEACSPGGDMYQRSRLERLISGQSLSSARDVIGQVHTHLLSFVDNAPQYDDITMLAVKWTR